MAFSVHLALHRLSHPYDLLPLLLHLCTDHARELSKLLWVAFSEDVDERRSDGGAPERHKTFYNVANNPSSWGALHSISKHSPVVYLKALKSIPSFALSLNNCQPNFCMSDYSSLTLGQRHEST